jgi:predicted amidohydrolase
MAVALRQLQRACVPRLRQHCVRAMASAAAAAAPPPRPKPKLAVAQMTSTSDAAANFAACERLARAAAGAGAALLCLPECCTFLGERDTDALAVAEPLDGPLLARFSALARDTGVWLSLGGLPEAGPPDAPGRRYNTHVLLSGDTGAVTASYRKVHLFDVDIPGRVTLRESNVTLPGEELVVADSPVGRLGMTVCYDVRWARLCAACVHTAR